MTALAHSARPGKGIPPQSYAEHVTHTITSASAHAVGADAFLTGEAGGLSGIVRPAAVYHDVGKLLSPNQYILETDAGHTALPVHHADAGVIALVRPPHPRWAPAVLVYSHHAGLPSFPEEKDRDGLAFRDVREADRRQSEAALDDLLAEHEALLGPTEDIPDGEASPPSGLYLRLALSCLADADHGDTARHYSQEPEPHLPPLLPEERLAALDRYVARLGAGKTDARTRLRQEVYAACRASMPPSAIVACDAAVGTGKTTAVMAHCLAVAAKRHLRHVFVVLPYTNIIDQAVDVYREALVLPGEEAEAIVAAHHHRADFQSPDARALGFLWNAPITVVTAVQFFESLAAATPSVLRKLHQLPGSAIFIDESHAALPVDLWPMAWHWLQDLTAHWGCHVILGSGSLTRFWELEEFHPEGKAVSVPELLPAALAQRVADREQKRIHYESAPDPLGEKALWQRVNALPGPRIVIVNTVQSAAVLARSWAERVGWDRVEHLSTALCPTDRKITLDRVKKRLADATDRDWCLVATSCAEAGLNLSFRSGFRERAGLVNLLQLAGRVSREDEYDDAVVTDFRLRTEGLLRANKGFDTAALVLGQMLAKGMPVEAALCTEALRREIRQGEPLKRTRALAKAEGAFDFPKVEELFTVIAAKTRTVVVDTSLLEQLRKGRKVDRRALQAGSVQLWAYKLDGLHLEEFRAYPGVFAWDLGYDAHIGVMAGLLQNVALQDAGFVIV